MAPENKKRRIWLLVKRFDLTDGTSVEECQPPEDLTSIVLSGEEASDAVLELIRDHLKITEQHLVLRLRNTRNSLVPINNQLSANNRISPYTLEVLRMHQFVTPSTSEVAKLKYQDYIRIAFATLTSRLEKLEAHSPDMGHKYTEKVSQDLKELQLSLDFMTKRFMEGEDAKWQGMFKKCPLW